MSSPVPGPREPDDPTASETPATPDATAADGAEAPDFGPSGYLPAKASARARKIVLRAPLGLQWVVGAIVAGVVVVVAGALFLSRSGPPGPPWVATVTIEQVDGGVALDDLDALLVTGGGPAVAFAGLAEHALAYCPATRRVEGVTDTGPATWHAATGRGFGVPSLATHPVLVHDGLAYVDPSTTRPGPRPAPDAEQPGCP